MYRKIEYFIKRILLLTLINVVSCASYGPVNSPEYNTLLEEATSFDKTEFILNSKVEWKIMYRDQCWTNTKHCSSKQIANVINPFASESAYESGILVLAKSTISILDWDEKNNKYIHKEALPISNINSLEMYAKRNRIRVGVTHNPPKYYLLTMQKPYENTEKLFIYLKSKAQDINAISFK